MEWARYAPLPWIIRQHRFGRGRPEVDHLVEAICRVHLLIRLASGVTLIIWSPLFLIVVVAKTMQALGYWFDDKAFPWIAKETGLARVHRIIAALKDRRLAISSQAYKIKQQVLRETTVEGE